MTDTAQIQCTFCLLVNVVTSDDSLCNNCGLDLSRIRDAGDRPPVHPRPEIQAAPAEPRMKPKRKRKPLSKSKPSKEPDAMDAAVDRPVSPNTIGDTDLGRRMADDLLGIGATETSQPVDERFEATVFMGVATSEPTPEPGATSWLLEFEGDTSIVLPSDDVVLGRHPEDTDDAMLIDVPDPMRRLSRTHARLRRDATNDIWTIEDMGSSNGVSLYDSDTRTWRRVSPRQPIIATEYVALGPLRARLARRDTKSPSATTT